MDDVDDARGPRGIQSIEVGGQLLRALAHHGRPMALKDLARDAGMPPAKAHPYLVSFGKLGLIEQEAGSGRYGLGPLALQLGLISLQQHDPVRLAAPLADEFAAATGHTAAIVVWGNRGPTVVQVAGAPAPVHVAMRHGTVMSLRGTASGLLFAAWLPREVVAPLLDGPADAAFEAALAEVRTRRLARAVEVSLPGVAALAAPVFDGRGALALTITTIGPSATFDSSWDGPLAVALQRLADGLSRRLGWQPAEVSSAP